MIKTKWEYKTIEIKAKSVKQALFAKAYNPEDELNALGAEGWELVNVVGGATGPQAISFAFLKRPMN